MPIMRNTLITLLITALIGLWIVLHPADKQAAFELDDAHLSKGPLIALVMSRTGHGRDVGEAVEHGVRHYLSKLMAQPEHETIGLITFDDRSDLTEARRIAGEIAANPRVVAVLGHTDNATTLASMPVYDAAGIPMLTPTADAHEITEAGHWAFATVMSDAEQGQFLAFYVGQAMEGKQVVMFAHEAHMASSRITQFHKTAKAEGIKVSDYEVPEHQGHLKNDARGGLTATIKQLDPDVIFLSLTADHTEDLLVALNDMGYKKRIIANGPVGTPYFARRFADMPKEKEAPGYYTNGVVVPVPFILDMANSLAHAENTLYHAQYGHDMSWPFAYGYDAAKVLVEAMQRFHTAVAHGAMDKGADRVGIRDALQGMHHADTGVLGLTGITFFNKQGAGQRPPIFGAFRARSLTSALNQFAVNSMPLEHYDPLEHIKHIEVDGEVFGLSDVVYTGVRFHHLEKFDIEKRTVLADFDIWFRYHGQFDPADIVFDHAVEDSLSMAVIDAHGADHIQYKKIRVKAKFYFHLAPVDFLQHKVDVLLSFQHRKMNRNELIYVVDRSAYNTNQFNIPLIAQMRHDGVLHESEEAVLNNAVLFEDVSIVRAFGDPVFIDGKLPFSHFNAEVRLHQKGLSIPRQLGRFLSHRQELRLFFVLALLFLVTWYSPMRRWFGQRTEILRYATLAGALIGAELLFLTEGANYLNVDLATLELVVKILDSVWYILGASLVHSIMSRHLWPYVERSTGYPVTSLVRTLVSMVIFAGAAIIVYTVVFGQSVISIVAASGALTIVLGFALRELIVDFFAGIILGIERAFRIGDYCQFHLGGEVVQGTIEEMNWRTVRLRDAWGAVVVLPNNKISVQHLTNQSLAKHIEWTLHVYLDPSYEPDRIMALLQQAVADNPHVMGYGTALAPSVHYQGCENVSGMWVAHYTVQFHMQPMGQGGMASELIWKRIWHEFADADVSIDPSMHQSNRPRPTPV